MSIANSHWSGVGGAGGAADAVEGFCLGGLCVDGDELGLIRTQAALLDVREVAEDVAAAVVVELGEQVGGVVGLRALEDEPHAQ